MSCIYFSSYIKQNPAPFPVVGFRFAVFFVFYSAVGVLANRSKILFYHNFLHHFSFISKNLQQINALPTGRQALEMPARETEIFCLTVILTLGFKQPVSF